MDEWGVGEDQLAADKGSEMKPNHFFVHLSGNRKFGTSRCLESSLVLAVVGELSVHRCIHWFFTPDQLNQ